MKHALFFVFIFVSFMLFSQTKTEKPKFEYSPLSLQLELGILPIYAINTDTKNSVIGKLGLQYTYQNHFQIGVFGQTMNYFSSEDIVNIDNKIIELQSTQLSSVGLSFGYVLNAKRLQIVPNVDFCYNFLTAKAIEFPETQKAFLDYRFVNVSPQIRLGYKITEYFALGILGAYQLNVFYIKGKKIDDFNPTGIHGKLYTTITIK